MGRPVVHFEVIGRDGAALQKFYSELFGWKINADNEMNYGMVDTGGEGGIGGGIAGSDDARYATFYVQVDDPQTELDRATELGGKVKVPPMDLPMGITIALLEDPDGNVVGLVTPPPEGAPGAGT